MVETITPVVYGGRGRWAVAVGVHVAAAALTAAAFGAALGWAGSALGAPFGRAGTAFVALAALVYAAGTWPGVSVPVPALRRQVPDWWRTFYPPMVTSFLYGAGLGIGFLTFLSTGALAVVSLAAVLSGSAAAGAVLVGMFGATRGLSALTARRVRTSRDGRDLVERLAARSQAARLGAAAASLTAVAVAALMTVPDAGEGGAVGLAGAILAGVFGWAAVSKALAPKRWRRALAAHDLPPTIERLAVRGVPIAEAAVLGLALGGHHRAAAAWALLLLAAFGGAVIRAAVRTGSSVACGCFGGRVERPAWALLLRVGVLGVLAGLTAAWAPDTPVLSWPGSPGPGEILPMVLAGAGLGVAGFAAWQGSTWLGRGRA